MYDDVQSIIPIIVSTSQKNLFLPSYRKLGRDLKMKSWFFEFNANFSIKRTNLRKKNSFKLKHKWLLLLNILFTCRFQLFTLLVRTSMTLHKKKSPRHEILKESVRWQVKYSTNLFKNYFCVSCVIISLAFSFRSKPQTR